MNNKTILQLIKQDLEELNILVDDLSATEFPDQLLIDITRSKAQTMLKEFLLLTGTASKNTDDQSISIENAFDTEPQELIIKDEIAPEAEPIPEPTISIQEIIVVEESLEETIVEISPAQIKEDSFIEESTPTFEPEIEEQQTSEEILTTEIPAESDIIEESNQIEEIESTDEPIQETTNIQVSTIESISETHQTIQEVNIFDREDKVEDPYSMSEHTNNLLSAEALEKNEKKVFGEQFSKEPTLNERLGSMKSTESKIKGLPVTSLKAAIGLNDRFLFTRELFGNINSKFESTIEALDQAKDIVEAIEYLEQNFKWQKNDTSLKFIELVKRRFEK
jgi:hypothetical protein